MLLLCLCGKAAAFDGKSSAISSGWGVDFPASFCPECGGSLGGYSCEINYADSYFPLIPSRTRSSVFRTPPTLLPGDLDDTGFSDALPAHLLDEWEDDLNQLPVPIAVV